MIAYRWNLNVLSDLGEVGNQLVRILKKSITFLFGSACKQTIVIFPWLTKLVLGPKCFTLAYI